jgi:hypothetical protein
MDPEQLCQHLFGHWSWKSDLVNPWKRTPGGWTRIDENESQSYDRSWIQSARCAGKTRLMLDRAGAVKCQDKRGFGRLLLVTQLAQIVQ